MKKIPSTFKRHFKHQISIIISILLLSGFAFGCIFTQDVHAEGETQLPVAQGVSNEYTISSNQSFIAKTSGTYYMELSGGGNFNKHSWGGLVDTQGGYVAGAVELSSGDIVRVVYLPGGTSGAKIGSCDGQPGLALEVNGKLVMGAAGAGGAYTMGNGLGDWYCYPTNYSTNGQPLSGGAGGYSSYGNCQNGTGYYADKYAKAWTETYTSPLVGQKYGEPGGNYIDTTVVSEPVNGTATTAVENTTSQSKDGTTYTWGDRYAKFRVTNSGLTYTSVTKIVKEELLKSTVNVAPSEAHILVCVNQEFKCNVIANTDSVVGGKYTNGLTITKQKENLMSIEGKETTTGLKTYKIDNITVYITAIEEPSSSNVKAVLN